MRRALGLLVLVLALAPAAPAQRRHLTLQPVSARWYGADGALFVRASWTPASRPTAVSVEVDHYGRAVGRVQVRGWLLGHRTFVLRLAGRVASGTVLEVQVRATSSAGSGLRVVRVPVP